MQFEIVIMEVDGPICILVAPAMTICAALASKVFTQHGYLTGLTMARTLIFDDRLFSSKRVSFQRATCGGQFRSMYFVFYSDHTLLGLQWLTWNSVII